MNVEILQDVLTMVTEIVNAKFHNEELCFSFFFICHIHSQESELYRYILDWTSALAWELPFSRCLGHLSST